MKGGTKAALPNRGVQAFIVAVGFLETPEAWEAEWKRAGGDPGEVITLAENIWVTAKHGEDTNWSAARWAKPGDIVLFYSTKRSLAAADRLFKKFQQEKPGSPKAEFFWRARYVLERVAGRIFVAGRVKKSAAIEKNAPKLPWTDRYYADIGDLKLIEPFPVSVMRNEIAIRRRATVTPLTALQFNRLRERLKGYNDLPEWLLSVEVADLAYVSADGGWRAVAARSDIRFQTETQFRGALLDGFLEELAGESAEILREVQCWRRGRPTGIVDYILRTNSGILPIEAKLDRTLTSALAEQVRQYLGVTEFKNGGAVRERVKGGTTRVLVADSGGVFVTDISHVESDALAPPRWTWAALAALSTDDLQAAIWA